jgi:hypothetical protein
VDYDDDQNDRNQENVPYLILDGIEEDQQDIEEGIYDNGSNTNGDMLE